MTSTSKPKLSVERRLAAKAQSLGFEAFGIADASVPWTHDQHLLKYLQQGWQAEMDWMAETAERRAHPTALWPDVKSVITLGTSYAPPHDPLEDLDGKTQGAISVYASRADYHEVIKGRLKELAAQVVKLTGAEVKVFVDTAPVMEKPLAQRAGLGWAGKHTVLVSRQHGSWLFLGSIFTTAALTTSPSETDHCGSCTRCLDICPTQAFPAPYKLDARRCIAYLTNEHKSQIPLEFRVAIGNRIFGCDDCLAVCPWNKFARTSRDHKLAYRQDLRGLDLVALSQLDDASFRQQFRKTPVKRLGRDRFVRNVVLAMGNANNPHMTEPLRARLCDDSALVRGMAVWALSRYYVPQMMRTLYEPHKTIESDAEVQAEWQRACADTQGGL